MGLTPLSTFNLSQHSVYLGVNHGSFMFMNLYYHPNQRGDLAHTISYAQAEVGAVRGKLFLRQTDVSSRMPIDSITRPSLLGLFRKSSRVPKEGLFELRDGDILTSQSTACKIRFNPQTADIALEPSSLVIDDFSTLAAPENPTVKNFDFKYRGTPQSCTRFTESAMLYLIREGFPADYAMRQLEIGARELFIQPRLWNDVDLHRVLDRTLFFPPQGGLVTIGKNPGEGGLKTPDSLNMVLNRHIQIFVPRSGREEFTVQTVGDQASATTVFLSRHEVGRSKERIATSHTLSHDGSIAMEDGDVLTFGTASYRLETEKPARLTRLDEFPIPIRPMSHVRVYARAKG